jgi:hypothetical protein
MWKKIKQMFCKHTYVPSTTVGMEVCIDCRKLKNI